MKTVSNIRRATADDLHTIIALSARLKNHHRKLNSYSDVNTARPSSHARRLRMIAKRRNTIILVARENQTICGYIWADFFRPAKNLKRPKTIASIVEIYIVESARRRRLASKLLGELLIQLRERGVQHVEVSVYSSNSRAVKFWQQNGFSEYLKTLKLDV
jgi:ribosomal protein S18 acetylase RimI-like enzyme